MNPRNLVPKSKTGFLLLKEFRITDSFKEKQFEIVSLMNEEPPIAVASNKTAKPIDFLVGDTVLLVVSENAKLFFEKHVNQSCVEFVPVIVENFPQNINYWVLNVLEEIKCFDWEKSEYTLFEGLAPNGNKMIDEVSKVIFHTEKIGKKEIFYSSEFPVRVFISPKLEKELLASNLTGFEIWDFETYP